MAKIRLVTSETSQSIDVQPGETLLETLRRGGIPPSSVLTLDDRGEYLSLSERPADQTVAWAYAMRNIDYKVVQPDFERRAAEVPAAESFRQGRDGNKLALVEFSRKEAFEYIYASFLDSMSEYFSRDDGDKSLQVALSPGGDGRVLAECLSRLRDDHDDLTVHCVIMAAGFEDESEHLTHGTRLAEQYGFSYDTFTAAEVSSRWVL
jgi:hypothetical protein